jgi:hypothetical protein
MIVFVEEYSTLFPRRRSEKVAPAGQLTRANVPVILVLTD